MYYPMMLKVHYITHILFLARGAHIGAMISKDYKFLALRMVLITKVTTFILSSPLPPIFC